MKVTLKDIAARARVGTATVERVLNGRGGVRPATVERVIAAARALDYPKRLPKRHRGLTSIEVVLVRPESSFYRRLSNGFARIAATLDKTVAVQKTFLDEANPLAIAEHIANPKARRSALILAVPEHPAIRKALSAIVASGIPVVQIVTRMPGIGAHYVGIDNEAAGRMAGLLMAGLQRRPGQVIAICHSSGYAVHRDRIRGFSDFIERQAAHQFDFVRVSLARDEGRLARDRVQEALRAYPGLVGVYNAGGVNDVLCEVLRRRAKGREICLVGHELDEQSADALKAGDMSAVIDQAPETQARRSLDYVLNKLGLLDQHIDLTPIRFITVTPENV